MFGPTHSRYVPPVSRAPASELVLQRGGLPSEIALPGEASSPKLCIEGWAGCRLWKTKTKNFRLIMNRVAWNVEKSCFQKTSKNFCSVRLILDTYLPYRELPSTCCKGESCHPRSHYQGKPWVPPPPPGINVTYACSIGKKPNLITKTVALVLLFITFYDYYDPVLAPSQLLCRQQTAV